MKTNQRNTIIITGTPYVERIADTQSRDDHDSGLTSTEYAFGYKDLTINGKPLTKDEDKFIVYANDLSVARAEFWGRWQIFIKRAFNRNFVPILNK